MTRYLISLVFLLACAIPASTQTTITGALLDQDSRPLLVADIHVRSGMQDTTFLSARTMPDGSFSVALPGPGAYNLEFSGVNHQSVAVPFLALPDVSSRVVVRLGPYRFQDDLGSVQFVRMQPDNTAGDVYIPVKQPDGRYMAELKTDTSPFRYQLKGIETTGRTINGTSSEGYEYDGGGDYVSILTPHNGTLTIVFDPAKLVRGQGESKVEFEDGGTAAAKLPVVLRENDARRQDYMNAYSEFSHRNAGGKGFVYNWDPAMKDLLGEIENEKDEMIRQELRMEYLDLLSFGAKPPAPDATTKALKEIPPGSPLWVFHVDAVRFLMDYDTTGGKEYVERLFRENHEPGIKGTLLLSRLINARYAGDRAETRHLYDRIMKECAGTQWARTAARYSPDMKVYAGARVPRFSFVALDDPSRTLTNETFKGKYLLIDFWAVWCGPCVAEMENLHRAYERFKGDNFEVLSLSFDTSPADVKKFRDSRWKMPWNHAFVEKGFNNPTSREFEVDAIPKPMLVDGNGTIIAMTRELRGENLGKTLERYLGKRP